jgi:hypothetical protein
MKRVLLLLTIAVPAWSQQGSDAPAPSAPAPVRSAFHVRYVNGESVYIDGGREAGLAEGTKVVLKQNPSGADSAKEQVIEPGVLARLTVVAVATTSAVCQVTASSREIAVGDTLTLPEDEVANEVAKNALGNTRIYPIVVSFNLGDPLDEEVREAIPRPPLPEINQARFRFGFDVSTIRGLGAQGYTSTTVGVVARANITRIKGSFWNLDGYWRGGVESTSPAAQASIQDLIDRTYQMALTYINPQARWTAGVGRLYLPWASSLEVIDGGYFGWRTSPANTVGVFGGSTPDPTAWNYNPRRKIGGIFFNAEGGDFEGWRHSSTIGGGVALLGWNVDKPFVFTQNDISYKHVFSVYHAMQIDHPTANPGMPGVGTGVGQSFLSMRVQPASRLEFDFTHTYFRDVPTYDPALVGTGLLDKYLFQGVNGGARIRFPEHVTGYFSIGKSSTSSDTKASWNTMLGASMSNIWRTGLTADVRYARFDSAFAAGTYRMASISRDLNDRFRLSLQGGRQSFGSALTKDRGGYFANLLVETDLGSRYFLDSTFTTQRGGLEPYNQWSATIGFRFDNRAKDRMATHETQR